MTNNDFFSSKHLFINLNYTCNVHCLKCMTRHTDKIHAQMSLENLDRIIQILKENNYQGLITFGAGEPILFPHLEYLIRRFQVELPQINLRILSNGMALTKTLPKCFFNDNIHWGVTLDGMKQSEIHNYQFGLNIEEVKRNLGDLIEEYGPHHFYLNYTLNRKSIDSLEDFIDFSFKLGIKETYITELKVFDILDKSINDYVIDWDNEDITIKVKRFQEHAKKLSMKSKIYYSRYFVKEKCWERNNVQPIIDVDGRVNFCSGREDIFIGNIHDQDILDRWQFIFNQLTSSSRSHEWCSKCIDRPDSNGLRHIYSRHYLQGKKVKI